MSIVVYTCITGGYDRLILQPVEPGISYVCFTDRPDMGRARGWKLRPLEHPPGITNRTLMARYHKSMCYDRFPGCTTSIYIDGNVLLTRPPSQVAAVLGGGRHSFAAPPHSRRTTVAAELDACIATGKLSGDDVERARRMLEDQRQNGFRDDRGLTGSFALVRDPASPVLRQAMTEWWRMIAGHCHRDQLSLEYCLWRAGVETVRLARPAAGLPVALRLRHGAGRPPLGVALRLARARWRGLA